MMDLDELDLVDLVFDTHGNDRQKEAAEYWFDDTTEQILFGGAKYGGKSVVGSHLIFGDALTYPGTLYFIARETLQRLKQFTTPSIREVFGFWGLSQEDLAPYNGGDNAFHLYNGSKVYYLEAKYLPRDPMYQRFGSMQFTRGWIEESGEVDAQAAKMLFASVGRWKNREYGLKKKMLLTANPHKGYGYDYFYLPAKQGTLPDSMKFVKALPQDNKAGDPDYVRTLEELSDQVMRERLFLGNWEYDDDPTALCHYDDIVAIFDRSRVPGDEELARGKMYLTADIARLGSDKAVIMAWSDWYVLEMITLDVSKITDIQETITAMQTRWNIPNNRCLADEDGLGAGVVDTLNIQGFVNNARPLPESMGQRGRVRPQYANLQSQCGYGLARIIGENRILFACDTSSDERDTISRELEELKSWKPDDDNKRRIKPKAEIKKTIGRSPDYRDTLLMRYYFELRHTGTKLSAI